LAVRQGRGHRNGISLLHLVCIALLAAFDGGCGQILGVDGYTIGGDGRQNLCGALAVPKGQGCQTVGAIDCSSSGFEVQDGACLPLLPATDCPRGQRGAPGDRTCQDIDSACGREGFGVYVKAGDVYVKEGASPTNTGDTSDSPLPTVRQGIERAKARRVTNVWIAAGTYEDKGIVIDSPIILNGSCPTLVQIKARDATLPVIEFVAGADGAGLVRVTLTGGSAGVEIHHAGRISIGATWIVDVAGPGVIVDGSAENVQAPAPSAASPDGGALPDPAFSVGDGGAVGPRADATLNSVWIEDVSGAGIVAWGASLSLSQISVRRVSPMNELLPGHGISIHPAAVSYPSSRPARSTASITRTAVAKVEGAGVFVEGSDVTFEESAVSDVGPDGFGKGRGIVVQPRLAGNVKASLAAKRVLIERTHDAGVLAWSSHTSLDTVTIRDTGIGALNEPLTAAAGSCVGNGVRVRLDTTAQGRIGEAPPEEPLVEIKNSVIERARESAVHVEGARVDVTESILRDTLPDRCDAAFGDGVAAYSQIGRQADVRLVRTHVGKSARAAVASFGARVALESSVLECGSPSVGGSAATDPFSTDAASRCGCGDRWSSCAREVKTLPRALQGGLGCDGQGVCLSGCLTDWFGGGVTTIPGLTTWALGDDRMAATVTGQDGCWVFGGLTPGSGSDGKQFLAIAGAGYLASIGYMFPGGAPSHFGLIRTPNFRTLEFIESGNLLGKQYDFRTGYQVAVIVCDPPAGALDRDTEGCIMHGIVGARAELGGHQGRGMYNNPARTPELSLTSFTETGTALWQNVQPGAHEVLVWPPSDASGLRCSLGDSASSGWGKPLEGTNPVHVPITVRPGMSTVPFVYCARIP
jgi:hypothetical protein